MESDDYQSGQIIRAYDTLHANPVQDVPHVIYIYNINLSLGRQDFKTMQGLTWDMDDQDKIITDIFCGE